MITIRNPFRYEHFMLFAFLLLLPLACARQEDDGARQAAESARREAENARREAEKARAEALSAKAESEKAETASEDVRREEAQRDAAAKEKAIDDAKEAHRRHARAIAPQLVRVQQMGCYCGQGRVIVVSCRVVSGAEVPVQVGLGASARTGFLGISANGVTTMVIQPKADVVTQIVAPVATGLPGDCSSATNCDCIINSAEAK